MGIRAAADRRLIGAGRKPTVGLMVREVVLLCSTTLPQLANLYYEYAHLTVAATALLWLF